MDIVNKEIEVVSMLDRADIIKPVCFFIVEDNSMGEAISINRLIRRDKEKIGGRYIYTFTCEITVNNEVKLCDLRFDIEGDKWILYRI